MRIFHSGAYKINDLIADIQDKLIKIPYIQRKLVWDNNQKKRLLNTIKENRPFGCLILTKKPEDNYFQIIDGLQRTSTLLEFNRNPFKYCDIEELLEEFKKFLIKESVFSLEFDINDYEYQNKFKEIIKKLSEEKIYNPNILKSYCQLDPIAKQMTGAIHSFYNEFKNNVLNFNNRTILIETYVGNEQQISEIFIDINTQGKQLNDLDILKARLSNTNLVNTNKASLTILDNIQKDESNKYWDLDDLEEIEVKNVTYFDAINYLVGQLKQNLKDKKINFNFKKEEYFYKLIKLLMMYELLIRDIEHYDLDDCTLITNFFEQCLNSNFKFNDWIILINKTIHEMEKINLINNVNKNFISPGSSVLTFVYLYKLLRNNQNALADNEFVETLKIRLAKHYINDIVTKKFTSGTFKKIESMFINNVYDEEIKLESLLSKIDDINEQTNLLYLFHFLYIKFYNKKESDFAFEKISRFFDDTKLKPKKLGKSLWNYYIRSTISSSEFNLNSLYYDYYLNSCIDEDFRKHYIEIVTHLINQNTIDKTLFLGFCELRKQLLIKVFKNH